MGAVPDPQPGTLLPWGGWGPRGSEGATVKLHGHADQS